jgi:hypothetical protein
LLKRSGDVIQDAILNRGSYLLSLFIDDAIISKDPMHSDEYEELGPEGKVANQPAKHRIKTSKMD